MFKTNRFHTLFGKTAFTASLFAFLIPATAMAEEDGQTDETDTDGDGDTHELMIMSTTDVHSYLMPYDYMNAESVDDYGYAKTVSLIDQIRAEHEDALLFDNGDIIQGSLLGELEATVEPLEEGETQAIIKAFNDMDYDASTLGNHEFNFGLDFLDNQIEQADFPMLLANVYEAGTDKEEHKYQPYEIIEHEVDGKEIDVGVIGFTPPQIMQWDALHLEGEVEVRDIVESAQRYVPELAEQTDIVVSLAHTGVNTGDRGTEHAATSLAEEVDGIDALVMGHAHQTFPDNNESYDNVDGVDDEAGTIHGVPAVMAGSWGSHLGTIKLDLVEEDGEWSVENSQSEVTGVEESGAETDEGMVELLTDVHERTLEYVDSVVGQMADSFNTFFSRVMDNEVLQLVNDAQLWFTEDFLQDTEHEDKPLLSAAAPFQAGYRGGYTEVDEGDLRIRDLADIYIYDNTLQVVEVDRDGLIQWIERSAENFEQIDPNETDDQQLLASFSAFNFDVIEGVEYEIDVTQPAGERVTNLTYEGEEVAADQEFLVATNNYRAGGGGDHLEGLDAELVQELRALSIENRYVILDYLEENHDEYTPYASNNWQIKPVDVDGDVVFNSSVDGAEHIEKLGLDAVSATGETVEDSDSGAVYTYNFTDIMGTGDDTPETTIADLQAALDDNIDDGDVSGPAENQLTNSLDQAQHHYDNDNAKQAEKFVEDNFLKHLHRNPNARHIDDDAKAELDDLANETINSLEEN
ncbi:bifunctional 2',3'-cyclic-nucleotide 2'-phosphodiesterase/3'-nucleotidase [Salisediminibacterium halotolerans]|uniref:2',3'-cyclic-nucleotide 2'-phosphodiesterase / 3'-nucleotidase/2',3'-cyclic-nucleotide 2'-phosphodiesterase / 3'-nucleotidase / 5'-nucleotidase n=1 Tax=Salisediminibacterium halotolerans TaxID=517425 RepID=A0A1H9W2W0_9BACI|nr:bifunctional 2',3'-cyclic-nucleotide 2'-phosphodiesterase/3'-nucleotidase [Salisediminibacterium haloalkalitolerans]SES28188.1 2',3'-cyclic-nucleotide 2'-phosphodiesterase / 3'-nucleotidase/2',3'-cyclic-nucleotide 2'-phosphodiesterase / 3'-nucleotidase / 5'-nucleotidase [Salisediminibacterium haloalkalitolerans]